MKLSKYLDDYYFYTGKASENARAVAFAGIAIIWVFKSDVESRLQIPDDLLLPAVLLVVGIAADFLQYVVGAAVWWLFTTYHEARKKKPSDDPELGHSIWLQAPIMLFFISKLIAIVAAYFFIARYVYALRQAAQV